MNMKSNILLDPFFTIASDCRKLKFLTCYYSRYQCFNQGILVHCSCYHFGSSPLVICPSINQTRMKNIMKFDTIQFRIMQNYIFSLQISNDRPMSL